MKARLLTSLVLTVFSVSAYAQNVENDDMYFNAKDRVALRALNAKEEQAYASTRNERAKAVADVTEEEEILNPTDSYSARNVNPEYEARLNSDVAKSDDDNYFSPDYHYQTTSDLNSWNNNFGSQYNNSWYQNSYWTPGMYSWNSRYYGGGFYDPWSNIWYSPYTRPGWSSSISFSCGNSWNYGYGNSWSMNYGYGNYGYGYGNYGYGYGNPYNSYWYNSNRYWGGGYPQYVVVERSNPRAYGKRNSRSTSHPVAASGGSRPVTGSRPILGSSGSGRTEANGRTETGSRLNSNTSRQPALSRQPQPEHYNRSWRNQPSQGQPATTTSSDQPLSNTRSNERTTPSRSTPRSSGWNSGSGNNSSSGSSPSYTPSRSSGSSGNSGGSYTPSRSSGSSSSSGSNSRSSGSSGGSSSSGGSRSRGR